MLIPDIVNHYNANRSKLVKRMTFRMGNDAYAEDVVQEAYERIIRYHESFSGDDFDKWVNTILNNCLRDFKNIENGHTPDMFDEELSEGLSCTHYTDHVMREVFDLIDTKAANHQIILNLHFKYDYAPIDISRLTEFTYSNCHKIISRFREELRELYSER